MTILELHQEFVNRFVSFPGVRDLLSETVRVVADPEPETTLLPDKEPPSLINRPEYRVTAYFHDHKGEAYTECPRDFTGTLEQLLSLPMNDQGIDARFVAAVNAVLCFLTGSPGSFPDDPNAHKIYAERICSYVKEHYGTSRIVLIGYDGYLVKQFMDEGLDFWTLDRDPNHITKNRFHHIVVNSGYYNRESSFAWGRIFLVTGSTLCNGTIIQYLNSGKELLFYGITCAGAASLLQLPWFPTEKGL